MKDIANMGDEDCTSIGFIINEFFSGATMAVSQPEKQSAPVSCVVLHC